MEDTMSTNIDDLPGPQPQVELDPDLQLQENDIQSDSQKHVSFKDDVEYIEPKKNNFDLKTFVFKQFNEENLLLLGILFLAFLPQIDRYFYNIPLLGDYTYGNSIFSILLKASILLLIFILLKEFLLPHFKL